MAARTARQPKDDVLRHAQNERIEDKRKPAVRAKAASLLAALKDVLGVIEARATIPILSHVLIEVGDGELILTGSDLDLWARRELATDDRDGPGSAEWLASIVGFGMALPAKPLAEVLGAIDGEAMVTLSAPHGEEKRAVVSAGRARFKLAALPPDEFPLPPEFDFKASMEMPCSALADSFAAVEHAISSEETRYYLNGVFVHTAQADGEAPVLRFATTDGHRLARLSVAVPDGGASWPALIVGRKTVGLLDRLLAAAAKTTEGKDVTPAVVSIGASELAKGALLRFEMPAADDGVIEITAKMIDGDFPDYQRVIPSDPPHRAVIDRAALAEAVKRVMVLADGKSRAVKAEFSAGVLTLSATAMEIGEAREDLEIEYIGPDAVLGFDGKYWRDTLAALASEQVAMMFGEPADGAAGQPVRVAAWVNGAEEPRLTQVLMPMRV